MHNKQSKKKKKKKKQITTRTNYSRLQKEIDTFVEGARDPKDPLLLE